LSRRYPEIVALLAIVPGTIVRLAGPAAAAIVALVQQMQRLLGKPIHESDDLLVWKSPRGRKTRRL
jgi:hypothetical protein